MEEEEKEKRKRRRKKRNRKGKLDVQVRGRDRCSLSCSSYIRRSSYNSQYHFDFDSVRVALVLSLARDDKMRKKLDEVSRIESKKAA